LNAFYSLSRRGFWRNPLSRIDRRNRYAGIAAALSLILYAFFLDPEKVTLFKCVFKEWTGRNCFACGLSHSLHASAAFDWMGALQYHVFGPVLFLSALGLSAYWILELVLEVKGFIKPGRRNMRIFLVVVAFLWLFYWIYSLGDAPR